MRGAPQMERGRVFLKREEPEVMTAESARRAVRELRLQQIELERQNEELRHAQEALARSRARYLDLYDLAPVGYFALTQEGLIEQANFTAATLLGLSRNLLGKQLFVRFIDADDLPLYHRWRGSLLATGQAQSGELRMVRPDGTRVWSHLAITSAHNEVGSTELRVVIDDITARKAAEAALREGEGRYRALFSRASDGIVLLSLDGIVVDANEAFARMHGWSAAEMKNVHLELLGADPFPLSPERLRRMASGEVLTFEVEHRHRGGHSFPLEGSASQIALSEVPYVLVFFRDVSERRRMTASLAQSDRLASMGMLAAGIAHEINNPLAYVLSNIESIEHDLCQLGDDETTLFRDLTQRARSALEGTLRIRKISRGLGSFSRVEREPLHATNLNNAIENAINMAQHELKYRAQLGIDLGVIPHVLSTGGGLEQVFLNLLINAAHAIDEGHVEQNRISIRTWTSGDHVFAEVADTGRGIAPQHLERVFEPFFSTKDLGAGSGLGLSICRNIVSELGGSIRVESTLGAGSRFELRLNACFELPPEPAQRLPVAPSEAAPRGRLLLVDDEEPIRKLLQRLLGPHHEVVVAGSGQEAKRLLEIDPAFDVILCDLMMPEMTGMELHSWLLTYAPLLAQRMIFISGGAFTPSASSYLVRVKNLKLEKPFDMREVRRLVAERVAHAQRDGATSSAASTSG